jgi:hypothetical protein
MAEIKKRRFEMEDSKIIHSEQILKNQEQLSHYICQIGQLCETTVNMLNMIQVKVDNIEEKIKSIEKQNEYLEKNIQKVNYTFIQELKSKDNEIISLKELNQHIMKDYENKIYILENKPKKEDSSYSFYS